MRRRYWCRHAFTTPSTPSRNDRIRRFLKAFGGVARRLWYQHHGATSSYPKAFRKRLYEALLPHVGIIAIGRGSSSLETTNRLISGHSLQTLATKARPKLPVPPVIKTDLPFSIYGYTTIKIDRSQAFSLIFPKGNNI